MMIRSSSRAALLLSVAGVSLLISACSSTGDFCLCGYTTQSQFTRDIHTIRVPVFQNKTFSRGIEFELTAAVIRQIEARTPWKVVTDGNADAELTGTVIGLTKHLILQNQLNELREAEYTLGVEVALRDRSGRTLSGTAAAPFHDLPLTPEGAGVPDPLAPAAPPPAPPQLVQRSATAVPELGQSYASARKEAVDKMAEQIVSMMEAPW